jgi:alpha-1,6-mannosyltransferase
LKSLHGLQCVAFLVISGAAYFVPALPPTMCGRATIALYVSLTVLMFGVWRTSLRSNCTEHAWTMPCGIAVRLLLVFVPPFTTHDIDRYLWDGRVVLAGYDPYRLAPDAPALAALRSLWPTPAEHAHYTTLYPPGALAVFAATARIGGEAAPLVWKLLVAGASVGTLLAIVRLLRERGIERHLPLVALSPLLVLEGGVGGHLDLLAALTVALALLLATRNRPLAAGIAIGTGVLVKFLPGTLFLPLAAHFPGNERWRLLTGTIATVGLGYGLAVAFGLQPLGSFFVFFAKWRFGAPLFAVLAGVTPAPVSFLLGSLLVVGLLLSWILAQRGQLATGIEVALATPLMVSPVVFPWYLGPLAALSALEPSATLLAWLTAAPLSYEVLDRFAPGRGWSPRLWPLWVTGAGILLGVCFDLVRVAQARARRESTSR